MSFQARSLKKVKILLKKLKFLRVLYLMLLRSKSKYSFLLRKPILLILRKTLNINIITRDKLINNSEKYRVKRFGDEKIISFFKLFNVNSNVCANEIVEKTRKDEFFICEVDDGELAGPTALGFDKDGNILLETSLPISAIFGTSPSVTSGLKERIPVEECIPLRALSSRFLSKSNPPQLDIACSIVNAWRGNYYHWLVDCLARLEALEYYKNETGIKPTLIIGPNLNAWQMESLKLLGYEPEDYICWNISRMKVKRLLIPSFRRSPELHVSATACRWLRQRMINNLPNIESEKLPLSPNILISRRKAVGRRILNEDEVIDALKPFGFVSYTLEELSFWEEVKLFSQAKIVIGSQGAGLTNMIFSENLAVIELFSSSLVDDTFHNLAKELGFQYEFLKCKSPRTDFRQRDTDIIINVDNLRTLVASLLIHEEDVPQVA